MSADTLRTALTFLRIALQKTKDIADPKFSAPDVQHRIERLESAIKETEEAYRIELEAENANRK